MVLCDSNVWLVLAVSNHVHHPSVRKWFDAVDEPGMLCFCRATQQTFLRLLTSASVLSSYRNPPLTNGQAWEAYDALLTDDRILLRAEEPAGLERRWKRFAVSDSASPKIWMDAYLAAFALAGGHRRVTTDAALAVPGVGVGPGASWESRTALVHLFHGAEEGLAPETRS